MGLKDCSIDQKGNIYGPDGKWISKKQLLDSAGLMDEMIAGSSTTSSDEADYEYDNNSDYESSESISELLIRKIMDYHLPEKKKTLEDNLWVFFANGHQISMSNITSEAQKERIMELQHSAIVTSLLDKDVAREMSVSDYVQAHILIETQASRACSYEGDRFRDATIYGQKLNPGVIDALQNSAASITQSQSQNTGFFSSLFGNKRK